MSALDWGGTPPALRRPVLLVCLEGFIDAGVAASTASLFLRHRWRSELVATFSRDVFLDYRARRPTAVVDNGELRRIEWPATELFTAAVDGPRDAVLLLGTEPDMNWDAFFSEVIRACRRLGVEAAIGLGAYPAAVPHTRPIPVLQAANLAPGGLVVEAASIDGYTGPVGVGTALQAALGDAGIPSVGLWAEVPHYISATPNPAAALALVRAVGAAMETTIDTTELEAAASLHKGQVDEAVAEHEDAAGMVSALERHVDAGEDEPTVSGDALAAEIERFLRTQTD